MRLVQPGSLILILGSVVACRAIPYTDAELAAFRARPDGVALEFRTGKGRQATYYLTPAAGLRAAPRPLLIVFPGIGSRALERLDWAAWRPATAGMLLLDYPGRGECAGTLRPRDLPDTYAGALSALRAATGLTQDELLADLTLIGHSFGTAAALQFAQQYPPRRLVLLAPMTTLRRALFRKIGPLAWLNPDNLDSRELLRRLLDQDPALTVVLSHGTADDTIPVAMARELQQVAPARIVLHELPGGTHLSVLAADLSPDLVAPPP